MKKFSFILAVFTLIGFSTPIFAGEDLGTTVSQGFKCQYNQVGQESKESAKGDVSSEGQVDQGHAVETPQVK